jgi:hypothetical protein
VLAKRKRERMSLSSGLLLNPREQTI